MPEVLAEPIGERSDCTNAVEDGAHVIDINVDDGMLDGVLMRSRMVPM